MRAFRVIFPLLIVLVCSGFMFRAGGPGYQGICNSIGGCAEAWNVQRASLGQYSGALLEIENTTNSQTLNIGQTSTRSADVSGVSAFCGSSSTASGLTTYANCVVIKIYAEIHAGSNDLVPSVFSAPSGPNCSLGGTTCACVFTIEVATGLPILNTTTSPPCEYALAGDANAAGITAGTSSISLLYDGKAETTTYCCGPAGIGHAYNVVDTFGTTFYQSVANGQFGNNAGNQCQQPGTFCAGADEESIGDLVDYSASNIGSVFAATAFNSSTNQVSSYINGGQLRSPIEPAAALCTGCTGINLPGSVHVGGGGDLSQPAPALMRGFAITNNAVSQSSITAAYSNIKAFYNGELSFTDYATPSTAVSVVQTAPGAQNGSTGATSKTISFSGATGTTKHGAAVSLFWCAAGSCATNTTDVFAAGSVTVGSNSCSEVPNSFKAGPNGFQTEIWVCPNLTSSATAVTATTDGTSVGFLGVLATELDCPTSGCVVDKGGGGSVSASTWYCNATTSAATTQAGEFLYSIAASSKALSPRGSAGLNTSLSTTLQDEYAISGPSGSTYTASWLQAQTSGNAVCSVAAIEP